MNWRIKFKYIQHINIEFEFEDILNLCSIYSKFIHWIYKPMAALRAMCRHPKSWDYHMQNISHCRRESGGGVGHVSKPIICGSRVTICQQRRWRAYLMGLHLVKMRHLECRRFWNVICCGESITCRSVLWHPRLHWAQSVHWLWIRGAI